MPVVAAVQGPAGPRPPPGPGGRPPRRRRRRRRPSRRGAAPGRGHALVVVDIGGNTLPKSLFAWDRGPRSARPPDTPMVLADWDQIFATFNDKAKFPDGFTMIMNNQYNPFDDCTAPPYNI